MSFRIKTTHSLLQPSAQQPAQNDKVNILNLLGGGTDRQGTLFLDEHFTADSEKKQANNNRPKVGTNIGMAIRSVPTAQADHM